LQFGLRRSRFSSRQHHEPTRSLESDLAEVPGLVRLQRVVRRHEPREVLHLDHDSILPGRQRLDGERAALGVGVQERRRGGVDALWRDLRADDRRSGRVDHGADDPRARTCVALQPDQHLLGARPHVSQEQRRKHESAGRVDPDLQDLVRTVRHFKPAVGAGPIVAVEDLARAALVDLDADPVVLQRPVGLVDESAHD